MTQTALAEQLKVGQDTPVAPGAGGRFTMYPLGKNLTHGLLVSTLFMASSVLSAATITVTTSSDAPVGSLPDEECSPWDVSFRRQFQSPADMSEDRW